ncbi:MAG: SDR family oxidoreductase [Verrucomicrobia bacterium]|nr:SDR family oxidoreductase [Verrucomicrobiota bacterium]
MDLTGKNALVTGGAVRIGRAICRALAERGANIVVHYRSSSAQAEELREELIAMGVSAWTVEADLSQSGQCEELIESAIEAAGGLDILVNNAAVFSKAQIDAMTEQGIHDELWPNLVAPMLLTKAFAAQGRPGRIVNLLDRRISSLDTECVPYLISKKALHDFTLVSAKALAPGITVNAVAPGPVLPPPGEGENYLAEHAGPVPLEIRCSPEDIARAAVFLAEQDAVTGQVLFVDGGQHLLNGVEI